VIIVHKYGGSSVATTEKILNIARYLGKVKDEGNEVVAVVSAMGKTTDTLIRLANEITENPDKREMDRLMSTGEQQTIALLSIALQSLGYPAISLTGRQAGIRTGGHHTKNRIEEIKVENIKKHLKEGKIVINIENLYNAYIELDVVNTKTLKPYVNGVQSPAYAILMKANLI